MPDRTPRPLSNEARRRGGQNSHGSSTKEAQMCRELARQHTAEAIERLVFWMRSNNARASVPATRELLDRGWGRPKQEIEASGQGGGPIVLTWGDGTT